MLFLLNDLHSHFHLKYRVVIPRRFHLLHRAGHFLLYTIVSTSVEVLPRPRISLYTIPSFHYTPYLEKMQLLKMHFPITFHCFVEKNVLIKQRIRLLSQKDERGLERRDPNHFSLIIMILFPSPYFNQRSK